MALRGLPSQKNNIYLLVLIMSALAPWLTQCGQDPSFQTNEAGVATQDKDADATAGDSDGDGNPDSVIADLENPEEREKQLEHCADEGISNEDCFELRMVTMTGKQPDPGKVDILWIVDSSGSMTEEQSYLGNNFENFINRLTESQIDFQLAVTTTDVCQEVTPSALEEKRCPVNSSSTHHQGSFVGTVGNKVLRESTPNLNSTFKSYANVGISGSGFEHGLKAADLAVRKVVSGENEALMRDNSFLAVIVVSDEEDDGIGLSMTDPTGGHNYWAEGLTRFKYTDQDFIDYLKVIKGDGQFSVSTITGTTNPATNAPCTSPHSQPREIGSQYINAAEKTGGIVQSICETNWDTSLAKIGEDLSAQITQVVLDYPAIADTIQVSVNGQSETHWSYVTSSNSVKFDSAHIPAAGAVIIVEYLTK